MNREKMMKSRFLLWFTALCLIMTLIPVTSDASSGKYIDDLIPDRSFTPDEGAYTTTYTGDAIEADPVVRDDREKRLVEGRDYEISYSSPLRDPGRCTMTVTGKGEYEGSSVSEDIVVLPAPPSKVSLRLSAAAGGYDDLYCSWTPSKGATGYKVYFRRPAKGGTWYYLRSVTGNTCLMKDGYDGYRYQFRIVPYMDSEGVRFSSESDRVSASVATLKKVNNPVISRVSSSKVGVSWSNIYGERGYQISQSIYRNGTNIVSTWRTTSGKYRELPVKKGRTYYYKVRAYQFVTIGDRVYRVNGPWSGTVSYR